MRAIVGSSIVIENATPDAKSFCRKELTFSNPEYQKAVNMGKWAGNIPREIVLYQRMGDNLILPFGTLGDVFKHHNEFSEIVNNTLHEDHKHYDFGCNIEPYDYQQQAIEKALKKRNGVIVAPCGSGKTQMALAVAARIGLRTLWLTHTWDLMQQSMDRAKKCFSLPLGAYGTITAGKVNAGEVLTFATVQTMAKINLDEFKDYWDVVIVDECHKCVGTPTNIMMFYKVVNSLNARYKIGITATPKRADGLERCMFALLGETIHEITRDDVKDKTCPVHVCFSYTGFSPNLDEVLSADGTIAYANLISALTTDMERTEKIAKDIVIAASKGKSILVLSERVSHLHDLLESCVTLGVPEDKMRILSSVTTKQSREERRTALSDLKSGAINVVFATYKLAKEGLDVPTLNTLVLASPQKDRTTVVQSVGRVSRAAPGKDHGEVFDYIDNFGMLQGYAKKRVGYYKKLGCKLLTNME